MPDKLAKEINGVKLLVMGTVDTGGTGCVCPEHVMLKAILTSLVFRKDDVVIMDMEAGLEHLGRGTASMMDQFIVVIEPGARSVQTYEAHQAARGAISASRRCASWPTRSATSPTASSSAAASRRRICWASSATTPTSSTPTGRAFLPTINSPDGAGGDPRHQGSDRRAKNESERNDNLQ